MNSPLKLKGWRPTDGVKMPCVESSSEMEWECRFLGMPLASTYTKRLIFYLSRPSEHAVSGASPSKELIFRSATEDSQNSGSHKDQDRMSAVSLGIKIKIVAFATHRIMIRCSEKPFMQASIIPFKSLLFMMNFKCYTSNQKFTNELSL